MTRPSALTGFNEKTELGVVPEQTQLDVGPKPTPPPRPRFGDIIENGWASERNPTRAGLFVREGRRTGRMNPGRYFEVTDGAGKFWELPVDRDHKITVRPRTEALSLNPIALNAAVDALMDAGWWAQPRDRAEIAIRAYLCAAAGMGRAPCPTGLVRDEPQ